MQNIFKSTKAACCLACFAEESKAHFFLIRKQFFWNHSTRYFRSNHCITIFSIFLGTFLENQGIMKQR